MPEAYITPDVMGTKDRHQGHRYNKNKTSYIVRTLLSFDLVSIINTSIWHKLIAATSKEEVSKNWELFKEATTKNKLFSSSHSLDNSYCGTLISCFFDKEVLVPTKTTFQSTFNFAHEISPIDYPRRYEQPFVYDVRQKEISSQLKGQASTAKEFVAAAKKNWRFRSAPEGNDYLVDLAYLGYMANNIGLGKYAADKQIPVIFTQFGHHARDNMFCPITTKVAKLTNDSRDAGAIPFPCVQGSSQRRPWDLINLGQLTAGSYLKLNNQLIPKENLKEIMLIENKIITEDYDRQRDNNPHWKSNKNRLWIPKTLKT